MEKEPLQESQPVQPLVIDQTQQPEVPDQNITSSPLKFLKKLPKKSLIIGAGIITVLVVVMIAFQLTESIESGDAILSNPSSKRLLDKKGDFSLLDIGGVFKKDEPASPDKDATTTPIPTTSETSSPTPTLSSTTTSQPGSTSTPVPTETPISTPTPASNNVVSYTIDSSNFEFSKTNISASAGDTVRITLTNSGGNHDFVISEISGADTGLISSGETKTIEFTIPNNPQSSYTFFCSVGNHRALGMEGTLTIN